MAAHAMKTTQKATHTMKTNLEDIKALKADLEGDTRHKNYFKVRHTP